MIWQFLSISGKPVLSGQINIVWGSQKKSCLIVCHLIIPDLDQDTTFEHFLPLEWAWIK